MIYQSLKYSKSPDQALKTHSFTILAKSDPLLYFSQSLFDTLSFDLLYDLLLHLLHENSLLLTPSPSSLLFTLRLLLAPFAWWHPFIASLPSSLLDIVDAPVPLMIGTSEQIETTLPYVDLETMESRGIERGVSVFNEMKV
jgi:hypothetical protein